MAINEDNTQFQAWRSKVDSLYSDEGSLKNALGRNSNNSGRALSYEQKVSQLQSSMNDEKAASEYSESLAGTNSIYQSLLEFYKSMFYMRYTITPTHNGKHSKNEVELSDEEFEKMYDEMVNVVDGINIETVFPSLIYNAYLTGKVFIYVDKDKVSGTLSSLILPRSYCKQVFKTQFGSPIVSFDFSYFDDLLKVFAKNNESLNLTINDILELFPDEFQQKYKAYQRNKAIGKWQVLDAKRSTCVAANDTGLPAKMGADYGLLEYEKYKEIDLNRSEQELEKILVHQIPIDAEGDLIMDIDEINVIDKKMRSALRGAPHLRVLTTFGQTQLLELQKQRDKQVTLSNNAIRNIYVGAGMNPNIFIGEDDDSLKISLKREKANVWNIIQKLTLFYNICINNYYNWKPYQAQIDLLPITIYDENEMVTQYINNAGVGIGKLSAVVATGVKQKNIKDVSRVEKMLDLENILVPLHSMHTISDTPIDNNKDGAEKADKPIEQSNDDGVKNEN